MTSSFDSERFSRHVVRITAPDDGSPLGTGFFIGPGWLLTCAHVVGWSEYVGVTPHGSLVDGEPLSAHVRARSAAPEQGRNWSFPDLALLQLTRPFTHPCVLLSTELPDEHRPGYAWGYARGDFEAASGLRGSQTTFTFEGLEGGYLKLKAGQAQPGLSGAPLVCPSRKAVVGVIGWSRDLSSDLGALATPISALMDQATHGDAQLARFGAHLYERTRDAVGGTLGMWRCLFPIEEADNPLRRMDGEFSRQARSSPADLLHTDYGVVPFLFRDEESRRMREWCRSPAAMSAAIVTGYGGAGKTRFARELCRGMALEGWTTGLWPDAKGSDAARKVGELVRLQQPRLIVIDYVEGVPQDRLRADLDDLHAHATELSPVRVLLLHRTSNARGEGGSDLLLSLDRNTSGRVHNVLSAATVVNAAATGFGGSQRQELYKRAVESFRAAWYQGRRHDERAWASGAVQEHRGLESEQFSLPLEILFEALDNALRPNGSDGRPGVERILDHERRYWDATAPAGLGEEARLRCVALATLVGAWAETEARQLVGLALGGQADQAFIGRVLTWLRQLYPTPGVLNPLRPDRLGEHLIATVLTTAPSASGEEISAAELLREVLALPSDRQVAVCLDTLVRTLPYEPRVADAVRSALLTSHARLLDRASRQDREPGGAAASSASISHGLIRLMAGDLGARLARENSRAFEDHGLPGTYTRLGDEAAVLGLYDQAEQLYRNALRFHTAGPRRQGASAPMAASAMHLKLAELAARRAHFDDAEVWYQEAVAAAERAWERDPRDPRALAAVSSACRGLESIQRQLGKPRLAEQTRARAASVYAAFGHDGTVAGPPRTEAPRPVSDGLGHAGQIVSFHAFQGGVGRTMALANLAWILAANGKRVLIADWNLGSPGLHRYFAPSLLDPQALAVAQGLVNMVRGFQDLAAETPDEARGPGWYRSLARVSDYGVAIRWPFAGDGVLHYMSAGPQNRSYATTVATLDWERFYEQFGGGELFDAFRADMKENYDYAFIDSGSGLSDVADICTLHLPDVVVECFTLNNQSIEGALTVANAVSKFTSHPIRLLAVPMRVDGAEKSRADAVRAVARSRFAELRLDELASPRYWGQVEIPYVPFYSYEETLATFADSPNDRHTLLDAYLRLAGVLTNGEITSMPRMEEVERKAVLTEVSRLQPTWQERLMIAYAAEDRLWAEWLEALYTQENFDARIYPLFGDVASRPHIDANSKIIALMSAETTRDPDAMAQLRTWSSRGQLAVAALTELRSVFRLPAPTAELHGVADPVTATAMLLRLAEVPDAEIASAGPPEGQRFPTGHPMIWNVSARNAVFTGRDEAMERLRRQVTGGSTTVLLPVALHGLGGVGKTQLAREYAHRFSADYDLVWWINAESTEFIDEALAELARRLRLPGTGESSTDDSAAVREALRRGEAGHWLLIYDNATDPTLLKPFLPSGTSGHVLITSRDKAWAQQAVPLEVDVFTALESIEHLTRTVAGLSDEDAARIADLVGHLPLAVESAGAWLASTGHPVSQYIDRLRNQITEVLATPPADYPVSVAATWNIAMEELGRRRPAAAWLLELCAFMNPDGISTTRLVYSPEMLETLRQHDTSLVDTGMIGTVVAEPVRLSLLQLDQVAWELRIHRLVQSVIRARMTPERREDAKHAVHRVLAAARPRTSDIDDPESWPSYALLWPHMTPSTAIDCDEGPVRQLLIDRVRYQWKRGEYRNALESGRQLEARWLQRIEEFGGRDTPPGGALYQQVLVTRNLLASVSRVQGAFQDAYRLDLEVLAEQERLLGTEHPHTLLSCLCVAGDLRGLGRFQEALERDQKTYELHHRVYNKGDAPLLSAANNLAVSYRLLGDCYRAAELDQSTYVQRRSVLGPTHLYTLHSSASLARDLRDAGQYKQSTDLLRGALADYRQSVGENSPETLRTAKSLAVSLRKGGELSESLALARDTLERYRSDFLPSNPDRQFCTLVYAAALSAMGNHEQARDLSVEVLTAYEQQLGLQHPYTLCCVNNIATYLRKLERHEEALTTAQRAHSGLTSVLGENHPYTLSAAGNVANSLADAGEYDLAQDMELTAARKLAEVLRPNHPDVLAIESNRSISLSLLGAIADSRQLRSRIVAQMEVALGRIHPNTKAAREADRLDWDLELQTI